MEEKKVQDWKRITTYFHPDEHKKLRLISIEKGISTSRYIRDIVMREIEHEKQPEVPQTS